MEGGRKKIQGSCFLNIYFPVILSSRTSPYHSAEHSRLESAPKGQEEQALPQQEIDQCREKGCYVVILHRLSKCWEALLFKVSYVIQDSSPYISY